MTSKDHRLSPGGKHLERKIHAQLDDSRHVEGLEEVLFYIIKLKELEFYEKLLDKLEVDRYSFVRKFIRLGLPFKEIEKQITFLNVASDVLSNSTLYISPFENPFRIREQLVLYPQVYFLYKLTEAVYFVTSDIKIEENDFERLYLSGVIENVVLKLDKFDELHPIPEVTYDFFIDLKKVRWKNRHVESFFKELNKIRKNLIYNEYRGSNPTFPPLNEIRTHIIFLLTSVGFTLYLDSAYYDFKLTEDVLILFLAACRTINRGENELSYEDVITAYKTYYKLLSTDIYELVDKIWREKSQNNGYLVCEKCSSYYKLQPGESPDDFSDECKCGGGLHYYEDINNLLEN